MRRDITIQHRLPKLSHLTCIARSFLRRQQHLRDEERVAQKIAAEESQCFEVGARVGGGVCEEVVTEGGWEEDWAEGGAVFETGGVSEGWCCGGRRGA